MPRFLFELAVFFRARLDALWARMIFDWIIRQAKEEWIEYKIIHYEATVRNVRGVLEFERERRKSQDGPTGGS